MNTRQRIREQNIKAFAELVEEDPAVIRAEFDRIEEENRMVNHLLDSRLAAGMTPAELAAASGLSIEKIVEMESGNDAGLSIPAVQAYLKGVGKTLRVSALPRPRPAKPRARRPRPVPALA
jgi:hypothetical protein